MTVEVFPTGPISGEVTGWRAACGALKPYLPDLPSEVILQRSRAGVCLYCGQAWCPGCKETQAVVTPALRAEDVGRTWEGGTGARKVAPGGDVR